MKHPLILSAGIVLAAWLVLDPAPVLAQVAEQEPNDACLAAQNVGATGGLPVIVSGSLETDYTADPPVFDIDFYQFDASPGMRMRAELRGATIGVGTLGDPYLGLFDSDCNLLAANDDSVLGLDSQIDLEVPADGVVVLAASGCCDNEFIGSHGQEGSYELSLLEAPPAIGSISGRVVSAFSGEPLSGIESPYAFAELFRCSNAGCFNYVVFLPIDADGMFRVETDDIGAPLEIGSYLVAARAEGYQPAETAPFAVGEAENYDVGDIALAPPPISMINVLPCVDLPAEGGVCRYTVDVHNNTADDIRGLGLEHRSGIGYWIDIGLQRIRGVQQKGCSHTLDGQPHVAV